MPNTHTQNYIVVIMHRVTEKTGMLPDAVRTMETSNKWWQSLLVKL